VLPSVINPDQVAYLKNRFIGQNIRTIMDIMGYTKLMDKNGIIAFLDFEKAFDTINWDVVNDRCGVTGLASASKCFLLPFGAIFVWKYNTE
jgi:hypothetical protein